VVHTFFSSRRCIMGQHPRKFDATRGQLLTNCAEMLVRQLEQKWALQMAGSSKGSGLLRSLACYSAAYLFVDVSESAWQVLHMNEAAVQQLGAHPDPHSQALGGGAWLCMLLSQA